MPINTQALHNDPVAALGFIEGQDGIILNIVAQAVAASRDALHGGHLIIDTRQPRGAFLVSPQYQLGFNTQGNPVSTRLSGLIAEICFCHAYSEQRAIPVLSKMMDRHQHPFNPRYLAPAIDLLRQNYFAEFAAIQACVHRNFCKIRGLVSRRSYLIDNYHVIPTSKLQQPRSYGFLEKIALRNNTNDVARRREALGRIIQNEYLLVEPDAR